jgi:hypothetical protein
METSVSENWRKEDSDSRGVRPFLTFCFLILFGNEQQILYGEMGRRFQRTPPGAALLAMSKDRSAEPGSLSTRRIDGALFN